MSQIYRDDSGNYVPTIVPDWPNIQTVSYDGSVACANALPKGVTLAMVWSSTDTFINIGAAPSAAADATSIPLTAKTYYYLPVGSKGRGSMQDGVDKIAFIKQTTAGTAWIVPC